MTRELPGNTHLAYTVYADTEWWRQLPASALPNDGRECVQVAASAHGRGGGCRWEFAVVQHEHDGRPILRLELSGDSFPAFEEIPEFFASLANGDSMHLAEVREILDSLGAVDETERVGV